MEEVVQIPLAPLVACGLIVVALVAGLSLGVWVWAMRRPASGPQAGASSGEMPTPVYVAVGAQIGLGLDSGDGVNRNWVDLLREKMPEGTRLVLLGRRGVTLRELNQVEILAAVTASPEIVTLWSVVSDATKRVDLATYIKELHQALITLTRRTEAEIILLNLPDISLLTEGVSDDQRSLIRGGVAQWNRAVADEASKYGRRVRVVDLYPISEQLFGERTKSDKADQSAGGGGNKVLAEAVWDAMRRPVG